MKVIGDLVWSILAGVAVTSGLGFTGAGTTFGLPGEVAYAVGGAAAIGMFIWRREDPGFWESDRERLERVMFSDPDWRQRAAADGEARRLEPDRGPGT